MFSQTPPPSGPQSRCFPERWIEGGREGGGGGGGGRTGGMNYKNITAEPDLAGKQNGVGSRRLEINIALDQADAHARTHMHARTCTHAHAHRAAELKAPTAHIFYKGSAGSTRADSVFRAKRTELNLGRWCEVGLGFGGGGVLEV